MDLSVVYEDEYLLIVDKPCGLLVIPTPKNEKHTLTNILNTNLELQGKTYRLHPCHRLDRETSGLIIYAKGKSIQKKTMALFHQRKIKKTYIAFVQGALAQKQSKISRPIEGQNAQTAYRLLEQRKDFAVVEISPSTGRTNQIRIHFKAIGHPIVGEARFAFRKDFCLRSKRLCLNANALEFAHPLTQKPVILNLDLPAHMKEFLAEH